MGAKARFAIAVCMGRYPDTVAVKRLALAAVLSALLAAPGLAVPEKRRALEPSGRLFTDISAGSEFTCGLEVGGAVRCWGDDTFGQLGYGVAQRSSPLQTPAGAGRVNIGGRALAVSSGEDHVCVLLEGGRVRCWGDGTFGQTGYGATTVVGDDEAPATAGPVRVGGAVIQISAGRFHTCALLEGGRVRCWGDGFYGQLGYGNTERIGDDEVPATAGDVPIGAPVIRISAGSAHTCALLEGGRVRCWGNGGDGRLGYGNIHNVGDDEPPASAGDVDIGGKATHIAAGKAHSCAILQGGAVRCWGRGFSGQLGYGNTRSIGDNEPPALAGDVPLGEAATEIALGKSHSCALLASGAVRCWGSGFHGQLGYGSTRSVGDNEFPSEMKALLSGEPVARISAGGAHTCAVLRSGRLRCWGLLWGGWPAFPGFYHYFDGEGLSLLETAHPIPGPHFPTESELVFHTPTEL